MQPPSVSSINAHALYGPIAIACTLRRRLLASESPALRLQVDAIVVVGFKAVTTAAVDSAVIIIGLNSVRSFKQVNVLTVLGV